MAVDRSYVSPNNAERQRLRALVDRLSDEQLSRPLGSGWTIAGVLGHLAFWDQRVLVLLERWEQGGPGSAPPPINRGDVDWINDAAKALCLALPPRTAARLAVATAEAVDGKVQALSEELAAANAAAGTPINLLRAQHRREHLDEIERALKG
ncbi:MAG: DinB family protein [Candidatus Rokubacteria bacterium]|nr:DinB family protein [Candidatus Rokubacteria bacterium]